MHQTDSPMVPFIYQDIRSLCIKLLKIVVKPTVISELDTQKKLVAFDCDKESNFLPPSQYSLGVAVTHELERVQKVDLVEKKDVRLFRIACRQIICGIFDKIVE